MNRSIKTVIFISTFILLVFLDSKTSAQQPENQTEFFIEKHIYKATADFPRIYTSDNARPAFMVTEPALKAMKNEKISVDYIRSIQTLKNQPYSDRKKFESALKEVMKMYKLSFKSLVVKSTTQIPTNSSGKYDFQKINEIFDIMS